MMGHDDHVGAPRQPTLGERALRRLLDVACEQEHPARGRDAQDAGPIVVTPARMRAWMQELELDAVPAPRLAGNAGCGGYVQRGRDTPVPHRCDSEAALDGPRATDVIDVAVTEHQQIDALHALLAQERQHGHLAGGPPAAKRRTRVVQQDVLASAHDHREALADVEHVDEGLAVLRCRAGRTRHW